MQEDSGERCEMQFKRVEILCIYAHAKLVVIAQQIIGSRWSATVCQRSIFCPKIQFDGKTFEMVNLDFCIKTDNF